jgi:hypothetical protein
MTQLTITIPDEVTYFFEEVLGYDPSDYEFMVLSSLQMALSEYPKPFKATERVDAVITHHLDDVHRSALLRELDGIEDKQLENEPQEKVLISPQIRAQREAQR